MLTGRCLPLSSINAPPSVVAGNLDTLDVLHRGDLSTDGVPLEGLPPAPPQPSQLRIDANSTATNPDLGACEVFGWCPVTLPWANAAQEVRRNEEAAGPVITAGSNTACVQRNASSESCRLVCGSEGRSSSPRVTRHARR